MIHRYVEILVLEWKSERRPLKLARTLHSQRLGDGSLRLGDRGTRRRGELPDHGRRVAMSPRLRVARRLHRRKYLILPASIAIVADRFAAQLASEMIKLIHRFHGIVACAVTCF